MLFGFFPGVVGGLRARQEGEPERTFPHILRQNYRNPIKVQISNPIWGSYLKLRTRAKYLALNTQCQGRKREINKIEVKT
jgi:hypothetical protein